MPEHFGFGETEENITAPPTTAKAGRVAAERILDGGKCPGVCIPPMGVQRAGV